MQIARWMAAILLAVLLPVHVPAADALAVRDVTFFVMSDPHIGFQDQNKPPRSTDDIVGDGRRQVERITGVIGTPYPDRGPLAALAPGSVATLRGLFIAGDLTDNQRWDAFTAIFPPAGIKTATGSVPIFLAVGNHDGDVDSPVRRGVLEVNRAHERAGRLAAISDDGLHYAVNWDGVHVLGLGLYPADTVDADLPFKYGKPGLGSWNDPRHALAFLKKYLREHVGASGQPVVLMHHYGFDGFSTNDWYWWTPQQRRAYYDALAGYNVAAILPGHDHHAAHYLWPNPEASAEETRRQFGDQPPPAPRPYDVFSCGNLCWVFRITGDRFVAAHYGGHGAGWDTELALVKPITSGVRLRVSGPAELRREAGNIPEVPAWLEKNFHKIGDAVGLDDAGQLQSGEVMSLQPGTGHLVTFDVWERKVPEPGEVTLGPPTGPEGWKNWMYGILAKPREGQVDSRRPTHDSSGKARG